MGNFTEENGNFTATPGGYNLGTSYMYDHLNTTLGVKVDVVLGFDVSATTVANWKIVGTPAVPYFGNTDDYYGMYSASTHGIQSSNTFGSYTTIVNPPTEGNAALRLGWGGWDPLLTPICEEAISSKTTPEAPLAPLDPLTQGYYITFIAGNNFKDLQGKDAKLEMGKNKVNVTTQKASLSTTNKYFFEMKTVSLVVDPPAVTQMEEGFGVAPEDVAPLL